MAWRNPQVVSSALSGVLLIVGFVGATAGIFSATLETALYLLAIFIGGWYFISFLLGLNIMFSNLAWALDNCHLANEFSTHNSYQLTSDQQHNDYKNNASNNTCDKLCIGWNYLNYFEQKQAFITLNSHQPQALSQTFNYYFSLHKPPTHPPKI